ncbi:MAG: hypothetical protein IT236_18910, partial [Bacteroidia bacterium]|nr:hypothetical protein [Bacteroidia bacterium]
WRIKATNAGHATAFQTFSLKVDSSNVLTNQLVIPVTPLTGYITRDKTINFSWNNLYSATSYSIEIKQNNTVITSTTSSINSFQYIFPITSAANYTCSWRVKALNASSISQFNIAQTFTIDLLPPAVSTPTTPASSGSVSPFVKDTTTLVWKRLGGNDTKADSLFIYNDASFANLVKRSVVSDSKIKINAIDPTNPLSAGTSTASAIQYYWRLKSVDSLGNTSGFSSSLGFLLY